MTPRVLRSERGTEVSLETPVVMAVVNVTPDSFSDGGQFQTTDAIKRQCDYFIEHDTDIIDVGGDGSLPKLPKDAGAAQSLMLEDTGIHRWVLTPGTNESFSAWHARLVKEASETHTIGIATGVSQASLVLL